MKKLTLSLDDKDVRTAHRLARERGTSVSAMVTRFIRAVAAKQRPERTDLPPVTRKLSGVIRLPKGKSEREIIEEALAEKHGIDL